MPELAQAADGLHPAEDLFHEFSFPLTHVIARMPRGPTVDRTPADLLRHVGRDVLDAHVGNEARHIVALVRPDRAARGGAGLQQQHRRVAFGGPRRVGRADVGDKPLSIVQQHVAEIRQLGFLAFALPIQHRLGIGRRLMGVIAPPLPVEVDRGIARVLGRVALRCVHAPKAFRQYFQDYQTFLRRPRIVTGSLDSDSPEFEIAIVQSDLSKFYDRVQPELLRRKFEQLGRDGDDPRFFELAGRVFDWRWADTKRALRHSREHGLDGFMNAALPQGLVASGFFANVVMQDFETRLRDAFGQVIDEALGITLVDAAYYVDDFRLVVQIPRSDPGLAEREVCDAISAWFQRQLDMTAPGLVVEQSKPKTTPGQHRSR